MNYTQGSIEWLWWYSCASQIHTTIPPIELIVDDSYRNRDEHEPIIGIIITIYILIIIIHIYDFKRSNECVDITL